ncbi:hypothetical protein BC938DRAFT_481706 [Jimgerdemannia flammicorona]|uniref:Uncharacterized protein n=1 Tax=Jimgerdemannia flammicorona TaxID=994334 RepID=A0A433QWP2_9FUNG|nr:hypothetical protein BC938DRAFT_481706 [Jimgerdemannia flammicorona]
MGSSMGSMGGMERSIPKSFAGGKFHSRNTLSMAEVLPRRSLVYCLTCPAIFDTKKALKQHCDNSLKHQLLLEFYHWKKSTVMGRSISFSIAPLARFAIPRHDGIEVRFCNTCQLHYRIPQPVKHYLNRSRHQTLARQQADKHAAFAVQEFQRTKARCVPRIIAIFSRNQHIHHKIFDSPHHQYNISDSPHQPLKYSNTIDFGNIDPRERMCPYDIINIINPSKKSPIALTAIHRESITSPFDISVQLPIEIAPLESTRVEIAFDKHGHPNGHYLEHLTFKFINLYDDDVPEDVILTLVATLGEPEPIPKPAVVKKNDLNNDAPPDCDTLLVYAFSNSTN